METIKIKYIGKEKTRIRPFAGSPKLDVKKDQIFDAEKKNLDFFLKNNCIEVKITDKPETATEKKKREKLEAQKAVMDAETAPKLVQDDDDSNNDTTTVGVDKDVPEAK